MNKRNEWPEDDRNEQCVFRNPTDLEGNCWDCGLSLREHERAAEMN